MRCTRSILPGLLVAAAMALAADLCFAEPIEWPTRPSDMRQLSFTRPGRIAETLVKEGDTVKAGDVLVQQDDSIERKELEILQILADDKTRIDFAQAALEKAEIDEEQADLAFEEEGVTDMELRAAKLEVKLKKASLAIAGIEQTQAQASRDQMLIRLQHMRLISPMPGRAERVFLREGESADALEKVIVIVQIDPLWVDVPVPVGEARSVRIGQKARVQYVADLLSGKAVPIQGKVVHKASVADAASSTLTVRVEFANPDHRPAGEHVKVTFDAEAPEAPAK